MRQLGQQAQFESLAKLVCGLLSVVTTADCALTLLPQAVTTAKNTELPQAWVLLVLGVAATVPCLVPAAKGESDGGPAYAAMLLRHTDSLTSVQPRDICEAGLLHPDVFFAVRLAFVVAAVHVVAGRGDVRVRLVCLTLRAHQ